MVDTEGNSPSVDNANIESEPLNNRDVFVPAFPAPSVRKPCPPLPPPLLPMTPSLKMRPLPPRSRMEPTESDVIALSAQENQTNGLEDRNTVTDCNDGNVINNDYNGVDGDESGDEDIVNIGIEIEAHATTRTSSDANNPQNSGRDDSGGQRHREHRRELRRRRRKERAAAEHQKKLENDARRFFILGFFALPLLWLVLILYFHNEHKDEDASPTIKKYYVQSRRMLIVYTLLFVTWFILFQVFSGELEALNILSVKGRSPTGI